MEAFLGGTAEAFTFLFSVQGLMIVVAGTLIAMTSSFLPGLGSSSLVAMVVIFTLDWDPTSVILLFGALTGGATFMGSITAILFNIPGSAPSSAALLDGYPLARKGYPQKAIACAATASAVGSLIGVVVLLAILPFVRPVLLAFGPFEFFLLALWGLTSLVAIPNKSPLKAVGMALLGLLLAMIGSEPTTGDPRWSFGSLELYQGVPLIPVLLGVFTFAEMISWVKRYDFETATLYSRAPDDSMLAGVVAVFRHIGLTFRSAIIGTVVGIIPGVGGTVASFIAYGQAAKDARDNNPEFGQGDIRGLIAPESAVDAKDGGSLLPAVAFGLPGSEAGVILIAVLAIHGIVPGIPMLTEQLPLTYLLVFALLASNILTSVVGVALSPMLARLTEFRVDRIVLPVFIVGLVAIIQINSQFSDVFFAIGVGIAAYFFKRNDWPRVPFIIAFVLGEFLESNLALSVQLIEYGRIVPYERPASLAIAGLIALSLWWMLRKPYGKKTREVAGDDLPIALLLGLGSLLLFAVSITQDRGYPTVSIAISLASVAAMATIAYSGWRASQRRLLPHVPPGQRFPLAIMALFPPVAIVTGFAPAIGIAVFLWLFVSNGRSMGSRLRAAAWGAATGAAVHYYIHEFAYLMIPEGLLWSAFG